MKPFFLLDVDGVLNVYPSITKKGFTQPKNTGKSTPFNWEKHVMSPPGWTDLEVLLTKDMAPYFAEIQEVYTVVWATTWGESVNDWICEHVGLPRNLPTIMWPSDEYARGNGQDPHDTSFARQWARHPWHRGSWKIKWVAEWMETYGLYKSEDGDLRYRPWVFVDDEVNRFDRLWLEKHWREDGPEDRLMDRLLYRVEDHLGLQTEDFENLLAWGRNHQVS